MDTSGLTRSIGDLLTPTDLPIACTLTATEKSQRLAEIRAIGQASLLSAETTGSRAVLRFHPSADTRERLEVIVVAESKCCAFLELDLTDHHEGVVLTVRAPAGGEQVIRELVEAFRGENAVPA